MMELYEHQRRLVDADPKRHLLAWGTGVGKSKTALELCRSSASVLVICPKILKENWRREIDKHADREAVSRFSILTKEEFKKHAATLGRHEAVIFDEAHYASGISSQISKAFAAYLKKHDPERVYLLTATPYLSTPWNVYVLANYLGADLRYGSFRAAYFYEVRMGARTVPMVRPNVAPQLKRIIESVGSVVRLEDCFDVPEQTDVTEWLELTAAQRKGIKDAYDAEHIVYFTRKHTIENGILYGDEYVEDMEYDCAKDERVLALCGENPKVVVVARYTKQLRHLERLLQEAEHETFLVDGSVKDRQDVIDRANASERCVFLVNAACAEGYELPTFPVMVFASLGFSYSQYVQMRGRIQRANNLKRNLYVHLVVKEGVDQAVFECMENKVDFVMSILR